MWWVATATLESKDKVTAKPPNHPCEARIECLVSALYIIYHISNSIIFEVDCMVIMSRRLRTPAAQAVLVVAMGACPLRTPPDWACGNCARLFIGCTLSAATPFPAHPLR